MNPLIKGSKFALLFIVVMSYFIGDWKGQAVALMDKEAKGEYRKKVFARTFNNPTGRKLPDGNYHLKGVLYYPAKYEDELLEWVPESGTQHPVSLRMEIKNSIVKGKSWLTQDDKTECEFSLTGKVDDFGLHLVEKKLKACDAFEKNILLQLDPSGSGSGSTITLKGPWISCETGFDKYCPYGGRLSLSSSKAEIKSDKQILAQVKEMENYVGRKYSGKLWQYYPSQNDDGSFIDQEDGRSYDMEVRLSKLLGDKIDGTYEAEVKISNGSDDIGEIKAVAKLRDGKFLIEEQEVLKQAYTSWALKTYILALEAGSDSFVKAHWHEVNNAPNGGFLKLKIK